MLIIYSDLPEIAAKNRGRTRHWLSTSTGEVIRCLSARRRRSFRAKQEFARKTAAGKMQQCKLRQQFADYQLPMV